MECRCRPEHLLDCPRCPDGKSELYIGQDNMTDNCCPLYECIPECNDPFLIRWNSTTDCGHIRYEITGSDYDPASEYARLEHPDGAWWYNESEIGYATYLQINFEELVNVTGIITRGDGVNGWTWRYLLATSTDGDNFTFISDFGGSYIIFDGNSNSTSQHLNYFPEPFNIRGLQIIPNMAGAIGALQFELIGCYSEPCCCDNITDVNGTKCSSPFVNWYSNTDFYGECECENPECVCVTDADGLQELCEEFFGRPMIIDCPNGTHPMFTEDALDKDGCCRPMECEEYCPTECPPIDCGCPYMIVNSTWEDEACCTHFDCLCNETMVDTVCPEYIDDLLACNETNEDLRWVGKIPDTCVRIVILNL